MTPSGAYEDEMGRFLRLSDEELARLLAGEVGVGDEAFEEVASLLAEARTAFATAPDEATRARHIAAISEASQLLADNGTPVARPVSKAHGPVGAQASRLPKWRRVMERTVSVGLKIVVGTIAASFSMVGLAFAGVDLPGQAAEQAFEAVLGVELPNQGDDVVDGAGLDEEASDAAHDLWAYISTTDDTGCVFGQNVAAIASGSDATPDHDPCAEEDATGDESTGQEKSAEGRDRAEDAQSKNPTDEGPGSGDGGDSGDGAADDGQSNNPTGEGRDSGDGAADDGQSNNPTGEGPGSGEGAADDGQSNNPTGEGPGSGEGAADGALDNKPVTKP